jgi:hypothetical protein
MKCYEYGPRLLLLAKNIYVSELGLAKFKLWLEKIFIRDKHASLLPTSVNYSRKNVLQSQLLLDHVLDS